MCYSLISHPSLSSLRCLLHCSKHMVTSQHHELRSLCPTLLKNLHPCSVQHLLSLTLLQSCIMLLEKPTVAQIMPLYVYVLSSHLVNNPSTCLGQLLFLFFSFSYHLLFFSMSLTLLYHLHSQGVALLSDTHTHTHARPKKS